MSIEDQRDPEKTYNKMTFTELNTKTNFNWLTELFIPVLNAYNLPSSSLTPSTVLRVSDVNYVIKAIALLDKTPPRTVAHLIGWRHVASNGPLSSEAFRQFTFEYAQVSSGVKKQSDRWESCFGLAKGYLPMAVSRLFIEKYFSSGEKTEAITLIETIQESYRQLIQTNEWLDPETRVNSLKKLNHVTKNVAYPEWILKNQELDKLYGLENETFAKELLVEENYLLGLLKFSINQDREFIQDFYKPVDFSKR